jgi:hypothetical protein
VPKDKSVSKVQKPRPLAKSGVQGTSIEMGAEKTVIARPTNNVDTTIEDFMVQSFMVQKGYNMGEPF